VTATRIVVAARHAGGAAARGAAADSAVDGGEGPGTGRRHLPFELQQQFESRRAPGPADKFAMRSTAEMYAQFPAWVHSGALPAAAVLDRVPAGVTASQGADAGPRSGRRRPPSPSVPRALASPPLPYPSSGAAADLQRDLLSKKRIFVGLLA
jgi:hypothetical protein